MTETMDEIMKRTLQSEMDSAFAQSLAMLIQGHQAELQRLHLDYAERFRQTETKRLRLEAELDALDEKLGNKEEIHRQEINQLRLELSGLQQANASLLADVASLRARLEAAETARDRLDSERQNLMDRVAAHHQEIVSLHAEIKSVSEKASAFSVRVTDADAQNQRLKKEAEELVAQLQHEKSLAMRVQQALEEQINLLTKQLGDFKKELSDNRQELADHKQQLADCEQELNDVKNEQILLASSCATLTKTADSCKLALQNANKRLSDSEEQLNQARFQLQTASEELEQQKLKAAQLVDQQLFMQQELNSCRTSLLDAQVREEKLRTSTSYQLGSSLVRAFRSRAGLIGLPGNLLNIYRASRNKRSVVKTVEQGGQGISSGFAEIDTVFTVQGVAAAEEYAYKNYANQRTLSLVLTHLAKLSLKIYPAEAVRLGKAALQLDDRPFRRKWLSFLLFDTGAITEAFLTLNALPSDHTLTSSERNKANYIRGCYNLFTADIGVPNADPDQVYEPLAKSIMYVASSSLPYHTTGYTLRTQNVVKTIAHGDWKLTCVTRPGYPYDRPDVTTSQDSVISQVDGIQYELLPGPHRRKIPLDEYFVESAKAIVARAKEAKAAVIHAASNYEAAIPALLAAKTLGVPFVYEVRGLWEYTSASKNVGWEQTERFELDKKLESFAASNADAVLTLTNGLADELIERGVEKSKISLAVNAIDPQEFVPAERDVVLTKSLGLKNDHFVIGYIGSIVAYEGLDDLLRAFAIVAGKLPNARLLIVGDGDTLPVLRHQAEQLEHSDKIIFTGKVPHAKVQKYFSLLNVVCLPRKNVKVCQLVSPLKPLEAMAMKVPLIVSDVAALKEMVIPGETGLVHVANDEQSLARSIISIANDKPMAEKLADNAHRLVIESRTWTQVGEVINGTYLKLTQPSQSASSEQSARSSETSPLKAEIMPIEIPPGRNSMSAEEKALLDEKLLLSYLSGGAADVLSFLDAQLTGRSDKFKAFCQLKAANLVLSYGDLGEAAKLTELALANDESVSTLRSAVRIYYKSASLERAKELAEMLQASTGITEADINLFNEVKGRLDLATWAKQPSEQCVLPLVKGRVLNVLAFSLPYTSVGYATRSHGLAVGIKNSGWDIRPYTRPGFPFDFKAELQGQELPTADEIDGIVYRRLFDAARHGMNEVEYLIHSVQLWEKVIEEELPEIVHAASNYVTALPAMIAARRKGIPFIYEVRGFWEITRSSRDNNFVNTDKYRFMELFETLVSCHADHVITITSAMKDELIIRGVPAEKISIAYNSVDPARFTPAPKNITLAERLGIPKDVPVIGYIGSFVDYEGLDDLVRAAAGLKAEGHDFRLLLVGDGAVFESLQQQVTELELEGFVIMTGRVPHDEVEDYYSLIDIAPFPRKPWEVCELVSPLKPFEAMALEKAVVASNTKALLEIVDHNRNGMVFQKGDAKSLQETLGTLLSDPAQRTQLGRNAREWINSERSWDVAGKTVVQSYSAVPSSVNS